MQQVRPILESPPTDAPALGYYRHYKGGVYQVLGIARHSETYEWMVLYRPATKNPTDQDYWVRPLAMFSEVGTFNGLLQTRFTPLSDTETVSLLAGL